MDHGQSLGYLGTEQERDLACFWWASPTLATVLAHTAASFSCPTCCCVRPKTAEPCRIEQQALIQLKGLGVG